MELFSLFGTIGLKDDGFNKGITEATAKGESFGSKFASVASGIGKAAAVGLGAAATAFGALSIKALQLGGDLEQSLGGIETLFKDSADIVIANAEKAYLTAGLNANDYMQQVTSFSASLLQSLGGDTEAAAKVADMAVIDMADNANKMGSSVESIQNAYQGFAKQNYTMLDNLKLGFGGTKSEMERLLLEAEKISGIKYDISNLDDVYQAIHVIQTELGITGTTAKEGMETFTGSINTAKAALANFLSGAGGVNAVVKSFSNAADVIIKNMRTLLPRLSSGLVEIFNGLIFKIPELMDAMLPPIVDAAVKLVSGFAAAIIKNLPKIIDVGKKIASALINGIGDVIPLLKPVTAALSFLSERLIEITPIAATFFAVWKGIEFLAFLETSGNVVKALDTMRIATESLTWAKIKDYGETFALNALYAKDFIVNLGKSTVELVKQAWQFTINTGLKVKDAFATWSAAAAADGMSLAQFLLNKVMDSSVVKWITSAALKAKDAIVTGAVAVATGAATAAQWLWNAAMTANPIGLIVVAVSGLIIGITALIKWLTKSKKEQDDVSESTDNLAKSQSNLSDSLKDNEKTLESYTKAATDMFKRISTESDLSVREMITNLLHNQETIEKWADNLEILGKRGIDEGLLQALRDAGPESSKIVARLAGSTESDLKALSAVYARGGTTATNALAASLNQGIESASNSAIITTKKSGKQIIDGLIDSLSDTMQDRMSATKDLFQGIVDSIKELYGIQSPSKVFAQIGKYTIEGFIEGLSSMMDKIKNTIKNIADITVNGIKNTLGIHSPSTVFAGFGKNVGQGFINGISDMSTAVNNAVNSVFGGLGGIIDYGLNFNANNANMGHLNGQTANIAPTASGNVIQHITLSVNADKVDDIVKLTQVFQDFAHNNIVFGGL